jgi:MoaA/NifB/PqqE/SkfB family radical SAM enzyme
MCDIWQRPESHELPVADLERHRESLISLGVRQVVLTGGEPLLHRNFTVLCGFFRGLNIRVTLLTTGLLLHAKAAQIATCVDEIIVSIDGPPAIHNTIRRIPRAFETISKGLATIQNLAPDLRITCRTTVQKLNHTQLRATVNAAQALNLAQISFLAADLSSAAFNREQPWDRSRQDQIALNPSELRALEVEIESVIEQYQPLIDTRFIAESATKLRRISRRFREHLEPITSESPQCNAPFVSTVMELDGSLRPCFFHPPVASTRSQTLAQALNSEPAQTFRKQLDVATNPTCQGCVCSLNYRDHQNAARIDGVPSPTTSCWTDR